MGKGRLIGLIIAGAVAYLSLLVMLLFVAPGTMIAVVLLTILLAACLWRFRPQTFAFFNGLRSQPTVMPEISDHYQKEVFLSDLVLCSQNAQRESRVALNRKRVTIGVAEGCDIVLPRNSGVSRLHAVIYYNEKDKQFYVVDQGSTNGTFLNNVRLSKGAEKLLCKGDVIRFSTAVYIVRSAYYQ